MLIGLPETRMFIRAELICFTSGWFTVVEFPLFHSQHLLVSGRRPTAQKSITSSIVLKYPRSGHLFFTELYGWIDILCPWSELCDGEVQDSCPHDTCARKQRTPHPLLLWRGWHLLPSGTCKVLLIIAVLDNAQGDCCAGKSLSRVCDVPLWAAGRVAAQHQGRPQDPLHWRLQVPSKCTPHLSWIG